MDSVLLVYLDVFKPYLYVNNRTMVIWEFLELKSKWILSKKNWTVKGILDRKVNVWRLLDSGKFKFEFCYITYKNKSVIPILNVSKVRSNKCIIIRDKGMQVNGNLSFVAEMVEPITNAENFRLIRSRSWLWKMKFVLWLWMGVCLLD